MVALLTMVGCVCFRLSADEIAIRVESAETDHILTEGEISGLISSQSDLVKRGGGRLIIDRSLEGYKGEIRVEEGYLLALHNKAFGDTDKGTVVSNGATLEFKHDTDALLFGKEQITVSGIGVNGCGALCHVGTVKDQWRAVFERITLAGDTRFGGVQYGGNAIYRRWDIRGSQGKLDMQGFDLEIKCNFGIAGADVVNPGNITVSGKNSQFCLENISARMNGSSQNILTICEGAKLSSQRFAPALKWSVVIDGGTLWEQNCTGDYEGKGRIDGPVTITEKGACFHPGVSGAHWTFGGNVTVNGPISNGSSSQCMYIIVPYSGDDAFDKIRICQELRESANQSQVNSSLLIHLYALAGADGSSPVYSGDFADEKLYLRFLGNPQALAFFDCDYVTLAGNQNGVIYRQQNGCVKLTGSDKVHRFKDLTVAGNAMLDVAGAGDIDIHTNALSVGGLYPAVAKMRISDTVLTTNWAGRVKNGSRNIHIGPVCNMSSDSYEVERYYGGRGILEIYEGTVASNIFNIGFVAESQNVLNGTCHGSLLVRGGKVVMTGANGDYVYNRIGSGGSGYVEVSGGTVEATGYIYPASVKHGRGLWYQKAGVTHIKSTSPGFIWGQFSSASDPSKGVYYQTGGYMQCDAAMVFGKTLYNSSNAGNQDQFTMAGGQMVVNHGVDLAGAPNAKTIANFNGGRFSAMFVQVLTNENQTSIGTGGNVSLGNTYAWINFNGGTNSYLRRTDKLTGREAYKSESFFYGDPEKMRLTSYGKGAIFDTAGYDRNLNHTITAPSGKGLTSLALPENIEISDWMFAGAPYIEISGDGSGASAVAEFDSANGRVTGFTITSPGNDYTEIAAKLTRGGYTNEIPLVCTLGAVASGGLTKTGDGVLKLNAVNTYGGVTRVEGGTLKAFHADAVPAGNGIEITGGTLDAGGFEKDYGAIFVTSGTLQNATGTFTSFVKEGEGAFMFDSSLSGSAPLEVKGGTLKLPVSVPGLVCGEKTYPQSGPYTEYSARQPLAGLGVELTPSRAYKLTVSGYYQPYHYVSYSGYVWNRSPTNETWTFAYAFDDFLNIYINGRNLAGEKQDDGAWGALTLAKATLKPGANSILIQLWNAPSTGGAVAHGLVKGCINWTKDHVGLVYNPNGGDSTNGLDYVHMTDPGDGSLFTVHPYDGSTIPEFDSLKMWPGTTLDTCDGIYAFGKELKVTEDVFANPIQVLGGIAFVSGSKVDVADIETLDRSQGAYTILETTHGVSGALPELDGGAWRLRVSSDGKNLELLPRRGTAVVVR